MHYCVKGKGFKVIKYLKSSIKKKRGRDSSRDSSRESKLNNNK